MFLKSHLALFAILAAVVVVVALIVTRPERPDVAQARGEVIAAQTTARKAILHADSLLGANLVLKKRADSARSELVKAHETSLVLDERFRRAKADLALATSASDTLDMEALSSRVIQVADSLVASKDKELSSALAADAVDSKRAEDAEAALARLNASCAKLDTAATHMVSASKPGFFARLRPSLIFGSVVGIDSHKHPVVSAGVGLGWSF